MVVYDVIEDNGFGKTKLVDTYKVEELNTLEEAIKEMDFRCEIYSDLNSDNLEEETSYFYFKNPRIT